MSSKTRTIGEDILALDTTLRRPRMTKRVRATLERMEELLTPNGSQWIQTRWTRHPGREWLKLGHEVDRIKRGAGAEAESIAPEIFVGEPIGYCSDGAAQRAAWEVLGKPDMANPKNWGRVFRLALTAELKILMHIPLPIREDEDDPEEGWANSDIRDSIIGLNDSVWGKWLQPVNYIRAALGKEPV